MPDDIQGLDIQGTDKFDEWWEAEHPSDDDVDEILEDDYSDGYLE